ACAVEQQVALAGVACERGGALKLRLSFGQPAKAEEQFCTHTGKAMVVGERGLCSEFVDQRKTNLRAEGHGKCDGAIELHDGRWLALRECLVERSDALPVRLFSGVRARVAGGDGSLQRVGAGPAVQSGAQLLRPFECGQAAMDG